MPLSMNDLEKLKQMQILCDQVIDHTEVLARCLETVKLLNQDLKQLEHLYDQDWLRLYDEPINDSELKQIQDVGQAGRHSVLSQDTIWNALQDAQEVQNSLLKSLNKNL